MVTLWSKVQQLKGQELKTTGPMSRPFTVLEVTEGTAYIVPTTKRKRPVRRDHVETAADLGLHGDAWTVGAVVSRCPTTQDASYIAAILRAVT